MRMVVYVLKSQKDGKLYIGCTANIEKRMQYHNNGRVFSTKNRRPLILIYQESFKDKYEAYRTERFYKTAVGKNILKSKLEHEPERAKNK